MFTPFNTRSSYRTIIRSIERDGGRRLEGFAGELWWDRRAVRPDALQRQKIQMVPVMQRSSEIFGKRSVSFFKNPMPISVRRAAAKWRLLSVWDCVGRFVCENSLKAVMTLLILIHWSLGAAFIQRSGRVLKRYGR